MDGQVTEMIIDSFKRLQGCLSEWSCMIHALVLYVLKNVIVFLTSPNISAVEPIQ